MRIFLVGFMGSGKSFTSKRLAAYLGFPFLDLDDWIELRAGQKIKDFFRDKGEERFRILESETLKMTGNLPTGVIACGGGTPCFNGNMDWMNEKGMTVFLNVPPDILTKRLEAASADRPVLHNSLPIAETVRTKLAERRPFYEKAHVHVRPENEQTDLARLIADQYSQIIGH